MVKVSVHPHIKFVIVIFAAMLVFIGQSFAMAQTPTTEVEIVGTITAMTSNSLTVGTQIFDTTSAEIKTGIAVGKLVKVHASQSPVGEWVAREVEIARPTATQSQTPAPNLTPTPTPINAFEITGTITALTDNSIVIGGQTIDLASAEIKNSLALNDVVKVHVAILNGQWIASEVESASIPVVVTLAANCTPAQPTGWVTYTIQSGDTLSSIALGSGSSVQAVADANCFRNSRNIQVGQTIFVARQPVLIQGRDGRHGHDDGPGHDLNDDHGNSNATDDNGNHNGSDADDNGNHGGNNGGSGGHNSGSDDGSGHG